MNDLTWPDSRQKSFSYLILIFTVVSTSWLLYKAWPFNTDDAFITFRYARHLYEGYGIRWNMHASPVEGYTNFLILIFAFVALLLHIPPIIFVKIISLIAFYLSIWIIYLLAELWLSPIMAALSALVFSTQLAVIWWTVSGLETMIYTFFILIGIYWFYISNFQNRYRYLLLSALALFFAALTRPEAPIVFALLFLLLAFELGKEKQMSLQNKFIKLFFFTFVFIIPYGIYFLWRWHYFGKLFPNSYYCKKIFRSPSSYHQSPWILIIQFLASYIYLILFAIISLIFRFRYRFLIFFGFVIMTCFIYYDVYPILGYLNRYFVPVLPYVIILAVCGIDLFIGDIVKRFFSKKSFLVYVCVSMIAIFFVIFYQVRIFENIVYSTKLYRFLNKSRFAMSAYIRQHSRSGDTVLLADAGIVPYTIQLNVEDYDCLNSSVYTSPKIDGSLTKYFSYILTYIKPKFIILESADKHKLIITNFSRLSVLLKNPEFVNNYVLVKYFIMYRGEQYYLLYMRRPRH